LNNNYESRNSEYVLTLLSSAFWFFFLCVRQVNVQLQRSELQMQLKWEIECKTEVEKLSIKCI